MPESFTPIRPLLAPIAGGEPYSLDIFLPVLTNLRPGDLVAIVGPDCSGKTTALRLLQRSRPSAITVFLEDTCLKDVCRALRTGAVVYTAEALLPLDHLAALRLAPWGQDQWIEYLLANHRAKCAGVMARLADARACARLRGNPELWQHALDALAANPDLPDPLAALRSIMARRSRTRTALRRRHPLAEAIAAAALIVPKVAAGDRAALPTRVNKDLLLELISNTSRPEFAAALDLAAADPGRPSHTVPVTVLHLAGAGWRPHAGARLTIPRACLPGLDWSGISLRYLNARQANLRGAALVGASINDAVFADASLQFAQFRRAQLGAASFLRADLSSSDIAEIVARRADFRESNLADANAEHADISSSLFNYATLSRARFVRADLSNAAFYCTVIENTDLSAANLAGANLTFTDFRTACLHGARLVGASFWKCRLDAVSAEALDLQKATFDKCDLSLSTLHNALFESARIRSCGLADVDWESANLRNADLRGSTFHAGSSRSGLVLSPIASEGTRTGFYTDEYEERTHKAPEEIRKANLCHADLRGANVTNVDFYLVDLRRAKYDPHQADWFKRCGAILFDKR